MGDIGVGVVHPYFGTLEDKLATALPIIHQFLQLQQLCHLLLDLHIHNIATSEWHEYTQAKGAYSI